MCKHAYTYTPRPSVETVIKIQTPVVGQERQVKRHDVVSVTVYHPFRASSGPRSRARDRVCTLRYSFVVLTVASDGGRGLRALVYACEMKRKKKRKKFKKNISSEKHTTKNKTLLSFGFIRARTRIYCTLYVINL